MFLSSVMLSTQIDLKMKDPENQLCSGFLMLSINLINPQPRSWWSSDVFPRVKFINDTLVCFPTQNWNKMIAHFVINITKQFRFLGLPTKCSGPSLFCTQSLSCVWALCSEATHVDLMVMQRSCSSLRVSVKRVSPARDDAMIPALDTSESVSVDLPWSTWAITDMFLMLDFLSMMARIWSTVKFTWWRRGGRVKGSCGVKTSRGCNIIYVHYQISTAVPIGVIKRKTCL